MPGCCTVVWLLLQQRLCQDQLLVHHHPPSPLCCWLVLLMMICWQGCRAAPGMLHPLQSLWLYQQKCMHCPSHAVAAVGRQRQQQQHPPMVLRTAKCSLQHTELHCLSCSCSTGCSILCLCLIGTSCCYPSFVAAVVHPGSELPPNCLRGFHLAGKLTCHNL